MLGHVQVGQFGISENLQYPFKKVINLDYECAVTCCCRDTPRQGDTYALSYFKKYLEENCWDQLFRQVAGQHWDTKIQDGVFG